VTEPVIDASTDRVYPSLAELERMASSAHFAPIYREVLADLETPVSALLKLGPGPGSFLFETAMGRYSFVAAGLDRSLEMFDDRAILHSAEGALDLECSDPLVLIDRVVARDGVARLPGLPPFCGGAVGYLSYELARKFEPRIPAAPNDPLGLPLATLLLVDTLLVFDHPRRTIKLVTIVPLAADLPAEYARGCQRLEKLAEKLRTTPLPPVPSGVDLPRDTKQPADRRLAVQGHEDTPRRAEFNGAIANLSRQEFEQRVVQAKEQIAAGECFQIVPSRRLSVRTDASPLGVYRALRSINPSTYMYYLNFGAYQIVGASPELLVETRDQWVRTVPIAGTMPRGTTALEDEALADRLLADEKERAEHVMLVDLARNDVGRVAEPGSVSVPRMVDIERYSHVMHLVSDVVGQLRADLRPVDALRAIFPAGTLTGAPKIRAMEIIAELEADRRGPYGGATGFFNLDGNLELAITIRTLVLKDGVAHIQAGAGVVADSEPAREYLESVNKARAVLAAIAEAERTEGHGATQEIAA
jgi:anthranilate synthase component I